MARRASSASSAAFRAASSARTRAARRWASCDSAVRAAFLKFSVEDARCYKEDERQHLLGVVETGFGSLDTFDELVRSLFAESLEKGASFKLEPGKGIEELPPSPPPGPPGKLEC